nr:MAG TPA: Glucuronan lyase A [Caudoviricetes sp.]
MARKPRKIGEGDWVTIQARVVASWPEDGKITVDINGQKLTIPSDLEAITDWTPREEDRVRYREE